MYNINKYLSIRKIKKYSLVVTKLSKLTREEFSPRKLNGVFFVVPVDRSGPVDERTSPKRFNSNGSLLKRNIYNYSILRAMDDACLSSSDEVSFF